MCFLSALHFFFLKRLHIIFLWGVPTVRPCGLIGMSPCPSSNGGHTTQPWAIRALCSVAPWPQWVHSEMTMTQAWPMSTALDFYWNYWDSGFLFLKWLSWKHIELELLGPSLLPAGESLLENDTHTWENRTQRQSETISCNIISANRRSHAWSMKLHTFQLHEPVYYRFC